MIGCDPILSHLVGMSVPPRYSGLALHDCICNRLSKFVDLVHESSDDAFIHRRRARYFASMESTAKSMHPYKAFSTRHWLKGAKIVVDSTYSQPVQSTSMMNGRHAEICGYCAEMFHYEVPVIHDSYSNTGCFGSWEKKTYNSTSALPVILVPKKKSDRHSC